MDVDDTFSVESAASLTSRLDSDPNNPLLNFTTTPEELELQSVKRQKTSRDPMSHRIIEKRRRDRMNNCLADLSRLIPTSYLKQGQGRIEKTEIIEMAIRHIKNLQAQVDGKPQTHASSKTLQGGGSGEQEKTSELSCCQQRFYMGFKECQEELMCYLVEGEGMLASEPFCNRISDYLNAAGQRFNVSQSRNEDKEGVQTELENQRLAPSPFHGGPSSQNMLEPLMPLLPNPVSAGMMIPASPVRDKHLRNLLTSRALQQLEGEQEGMVHPLNKPSCLDAVTPQSSTVTTVTTSSVSSTSPVPPFSGHDLCSDRAMNCATSESSLNGGHSSGYFSENSGVDRLSNISSSIAPAVLMTKDSRAINAYKFKHNITKRFSQEGKVISQSYDGSSSASSRDLDDEHQHGHHVKHRSSKVKSRHASSSDSGPYPTSECSSGLASGASHDGSSSSSGGGERNRSRHCKATARSSSMSNFAGSGGDCCSRAALPLPGFVLHPSGTHYMPMSVCHANIPDMFDAGMEAAPGAPVFHPISIPVHFRGPVISMPNINICTDTHGGDACKLADGTAQIKDCKDFK